MTASCVGPLRELEPDLDAVVGRQEVHARRLAHERVVVLQPQAERHEHLAGLDRELAVASASAMQIRLAILGVVGRDLLIDVQRQQIRHEREPRHRPWRATRRCPIAPRSPECRPTSSRRESRRRRRTSGSRRRRSRACGLRRARRLAPRSGCARTACRTRCACRRRSGLTWQLPHFRPLSTARYGSAVASARASSATRRAARAATMTSQWSVS